MRETLQSLLQKPLFLIIALVIAAVLFIIVILLLLRSRRGKGEREDLWRAEMVELERENQFAAATEQMPFARDADTIGREAAHVFQEFIGLPLLAIYAGREKDERLKNVLPKEESDGQPHSLKAPLPESLNANVLGNFWR